MTKFFGRRGRAAVMGFFMLALAPADALAQASPVNGALQAASVDTTAKPLGQSVAAAVGNAVSSTAGAVSSAVGSVMGAKPVSVTVPVSAAKPEIAKEAAWLYANGWPPAGADRALCGRHRPGARRAGQLHRRCRLS